MSLLTRFTTYDLELEVKLTFRNDKIILGITANGHQFRPSDWAERLCGVVSSALASPRVHGLRFSYCAYARPLVRDGQKCVLVLAKLRDVHPMAHDFLLRFAEDNELRTVDANNIGLSTNERRIEAAPMLVDCRRAG